jgi:hypothetical protein
MTKPWTTDGSGMGIIAFREEVDNQHDNLVISRWSGQQEDHNGIHLDGVTQPATVWETQLPDLTLQDGWNKDVNTPSMSEPINGSNGYQQPGGVTQTKDCEWHLTFNASPFFTRVPGYLDKPRLGH